MLALAVLQTNEPVLHPFLSGTRGGIQPRLHEPLEVLKGIGLSVAPETRGDNPKQRAVEPLFRRRLALRLVRGPIRFLTLIVTVPGREASATLQRNRNGLGTRRAKVGMRHVVPYSPLCAHSNLRRAF